MTTAVNPYVNRQTRKSPFSYYSGSDESLLELVKDNWENSKRGYREGVLLVSVPPKGFFTGVVTLQEGAALTGSYKARRDGETPRKQVLARGEKIPAVSVEVVLYRSDVLAEDGSNCLTPRLFTSTPQHNDIRHNWEIISINASPTEEATPIAPLTLLHNHFGSDGGTATGLSDSELVGMLRESFAFWKDKAMCKGEGR